HSLSIYILLHPCFLLFHTPSTPMIYTLSLHDALPISLLSGTKVPGYTEHAIPSRGVLDPGILLLQKPFTREILTRKVREALGARSEEHTSELQSRGHLVCRLLLEKKKKLKNHMLNSIF